MTVACTVLHNIASLRKERAPRVALDVDWDNAAIFPDNRNGRLVREQYIANYFSQFSFDLAHPLIKDNVGYITFSCVHAFYLASVAHTVVIFPNSSSTSLDQ